MMCMEVQYEDGDKDLIVFGDQGVSTEEHDKATYSKLTKTQKRSITWPYVQRTACHWRRKEGDLMNKEEGPKDKKPAGKIGLLKGPL